MPLACLGGISPATGRDIKGWAAGRGYRLRISHTGLSRMSYITKSLANNEVVLARFAIHWIVWIRVWALYLLVVTAPVAMAMHLHLRALEFGLTNRRVIRKEGVIARNTAEMKLLSIETVTVHQTVAARILGYGTIVVTGKTAGVSDVRLEKVKDPIEVKRAIENAKYSEPTSEAVSAAVAAN